MRWLGKQRRIRVKRERGPDGTGASLASRQARRESGKLLQCISDVIKRPFYSGADSLHEGDDPDRNSTSDKSILDGGRTRVVTQETQDELLHLMRSPVLPVSTPRHKRTRPLTEA